MTIRQLNQPCWALDPSPWDDDGSPHYETCAEAGQALTNLREERGPSPEDLAELEPVKVEKLPAPCWVAGCSVCDEQLQDDETGGNHFETAGDVEAVLASYEWAALPPDDAYCPDDRPEDAVPAPATPAQLEAAGQMPLPGVA